MRASGIEVHRHSTALAGLPTQSASIYYWWNLSAIRGKLVAVKRDNENKIVVVHLPVRECTTSQIPNRRTCTSEIGGPSETQAKRRGAGRRLCQSLLFVLSSKPHFEREKSQLSMTTQTGTASRCVPTYRWFCLHGFRPPECLLSTARCRIFH